MEECFKGNLLANLYSTVEFLKKELEEESQECNHIHLTLPLKRAITPNYSQGSSNKSCYSTNSSFITTSKYSIDDNTNTVFNELEGVDLELPLISSK